MGAGSAKKRKETTEGGGSAKKQQLEAPGGQGGDSAGQQQKLEAPSGQDGASAGKQQAPMRLPAKLSKEELQERKDSTKEAQAYLKKCSAFALETKYGEDGEEGDDLFDGMMESINHCALGETIREMVKNIPAPKATGNDWVETFQGRSRQILKELCVWLFEMACLEEMPGTGWEQYICKMEEVGLFNRKERDKYNFIALEEKYPRGYSRKCGVDDDDEW